MLRRFRWSTPGVYLGFHTDNTVVRTPGMMCRILERTARHAMMDSRKRRFGGNDRRALEVLAASGRHGCTDSTLLTHGFTVELLGLIRDGFARAQADRAWVDGQMIEVARVRLTNAGRQALKASRGRRSPIATSGSTCRSPG